MIENNNIIIVILILVYDFITDQKSELYKNIKDLTCLVNKNYHYSIYLLTFL